jgi:hypothetical protein
MTRSYPILQSDLFYKQTSEKKNLSDGQMIKCAEKMCTPTRKSTSSSSSSLSCDRFIPSSNWVLQSVRFWASSFNFRYLLASFRSSNSCLHPLPRLLVPIIFPSMMWLTKRFLGNMCPIQLPFLQSYCVKNVPFLLHSSLFMQSVPLIFSILLQHYISKLSRYFWSSFRRVQVSVPCNAMLQM